ncbi:hypothetical protein M3Y97_00049800 [Aphelenchoides bicaudatus]|nr:hypothetical protein M3Y97_00049800 [Aphelenchoides bicaudatus]
MVDKSPVQRGNISWSDSPHRNQKKPEHSVNSLMNKTDKLEKIDLPESQVPSWMNKTGAARTPVRQNVSMKRRHITINFEEDDLPVPLDENALKMSIEDDEVLQYHNLILSTKKHLPSHNSNNNHNHFSSYTGVNRQHGKPQAASISKVPSNSFSNRVRNVQIQSIVRQQVHPASRATVSASENRPSVWQPALMSDARQTAQRNHLMPRDQQATRQNKPASKFQSTNVQRVLFEKPKPRNYTQIYYTIKYNPLTQCVNSQASYPQLYLLIFSKPVMSSVIGFQSPTAEFPLIFLHAEIVKYFKERETEQNGEREEWFQRMEQSKSGKLDEIEQTLNRTLFLQGTAETRLEALGYRVGMALVERLSRDTPRLPTELENVKFICKDFWTYVFGKQVDNLRTNHQGIFVIQDNKFSFIANIAEGAQYLDQIAIYLSMPSGVVRGALANLGINARVSATVEKLPVVRFNVTIQPSSSDEKHEPQTPQR